MKPDGDRGERPKLERGGSNMGGRSRGEGWYLHNNQKKLLKMEVVEALEMRKWVVVALLGGMGLGMGVVGLVVRKAWEMGAGKGERLG